ncbi:hypothetical protein [Couchioplanes caeruleus]|uniref:Uncharacterized protein n=2 Tax=Couchioplanes caeruleus TaxID=56438 RepID=A0A1K0G9V4_9ACTN|nr:hypothetical protein [Couchioplanes caeruleus]OJF14018.1 hypothetical protein BG844_11855 [Couchioplanes caeruleus subsp. caeruleus]ROP30537.1 hypothetical protein EDD30_3394 [Couchioplanes caeruleus]
MAAIGVALVALLLIWPIGIRTGGGDHATPRICGNAFAGDVSQWHNDGDGPYRDLAYQACTTRRVDQVAMAVGVLAATVLGVTVLLARARRPTDPAERAASER